MPTFRTANTSAISAGSAFTFTPVGSASDLQVVSFELASTPAPNVTNTVGGWTLLREDHQGALTVAVFWRIAPADPSASSTWTFDQTCNGKAVSLAYYDHNPTTPFATSAATGASATTSIVAPDVTVSANDAKLLVLLAMHVSGVTDSTITLPVGMTSRATATSGVVAPYVTVRAADQTRNTGATGTRTGTASTAGDDVLGLSIVLAPENLPPNAPILGYPSGGQTVDRASTQRLSWTHSDPDGQSQSKYDLRYRLVGAASWTTVTGTTVNQFRDFTGGTFAAGDYEWQVRTYDSLGQVGPYSGSGFFTAADAPAGPTITDPVNGQTISAMTYDVVWSAADQDAYQGRTVADDGTGLPDTATVYTDTGTVEDKIARTAQVAFATNSRTEHVQWRVRFDGIWSAWTSVLVDVSFTPPPVPVIAPVAINTLGTGSGTNAIDLGLVNLPASPGDPEIIGQNFYRRETDVGGDGIRIAALLPADEGFIDHTPASGVDYQYRAESIGANGTSSSSPWTPEPAVVFDESLFDYAFFGGTA